MHELSIAISLLELVEEEALRREGCRIVAVHVKLGPLSGVGKDALAGAFGMAREKTPFATCELKIEEIPIVAYCSICKKDVPVKSIQDICCDVCGNVTPEIRTGRELEVSAMEIVDEPADAIG